MPQTRPDQSHPIRFGLICIDLAYGYIQLRTSAAIAIAYFLVMAQQFTQPDPVNATEIRIRNFAKCKFDSHFGKCNLRYAVHIIKRIDTCRTHPSPPAHPQLRSARRLSLHIHFDSRFSRFLVAHRKEINRLKRLSNVHYHKIFMHFIFRRSTRMQSCSCFNLLQYFFRVDYCTFASFYF